MTLKGTFDVLSFPEVLTMLAGNRATGRLHVRRRPAGIDLYFKDGQLVGARSGDRATNGHRDADSRLEDVCFGLLEAQRGSFEFTAETVDGSATPAVNVDAVLDRVSRRLEQWRRFEAVLDLAPRVITDGGWDKVTLSREQLRLILLADGQRNIRAIAHDLGTNPYDACLMLKILFDEGVLELTGRTVPTSDQEVLLFVDEWRKFQAVLELRPSVIRDLDRDKVTLSRDEWRLVMAADGRRSIRSLVDGLGGTEHQVCQTIKTLIDGGVLELTSPAVSPADDNHRVAFDQQAASGLTENVAWPDGVLPIESHRPWRPMVPELLAAAVVGLAVAVVTWFRMPPGPVVVLASLMLALAATEVVMVGGRTGRHRRRVHGRSRAAGRTKHRLNWLAELVLIVSIVLAVDVALEALVVKRYRTSSASMAPTIHVGQQLLVDRLSLRFQPPHRGDIVVFNPPAGSALHLCGEPRPGDQACPVPSPGRLTTSFVKRVVAVPGDRLAVIGARVYVNGKQQPGPRITGSISCDLCDLPRAITIPPGYFFVMGDNRGQSEDSRDWGPIPRSWLIGRVFFSYWPLSRLAVY